MRTQRVYDAEAAAITLELGTDLADRKRLESRVMQGVRIEAVARLAGGLAHDFNNIIAAIKCSCDLLAESLNADDARSVDVRAISDASARAAGLTRQLLAFTRQQVLLPHVVDLNDVARGADRMLQAIAGDAVTLTFDLAAEPVHVRADAAQVDQSLIHLAVPPRRALPRGRRGTMSRRVARHTTSRPVSLTVRVKATVSPIAA